MSGDFFGVLLAQGLQFVASRPVEITACDLIGDLGAALNTPRVVLRGAGATAVVPRTGTVPALRAALPRLAVADALLVRLTITITLRVRLTLTITLRIRLVTIATLVRLTLTITLRIRLVTIATLVR
ncbi:MAG: hypothetical protein EOO67_12065, partial [Microbacterium sp.]